MSSSRTSLKVPFHHTQCLAGLPTPSLSDLNNSDVTHRALAIPHDLGIPHPTHFSLCSVWLQIRNSDGCSESDLKNLQYAVQTQYAESACSGGTHKLWRDIHVFGTVKPTFSATSPAQQHYKYCINTMLYCSTKTHQPTVQTLLSSVCMRTKIKQSKTNILVFLSNSEQHNLLLWGMYIVF